MLLNSMQKKKEREKKEGEKSYQNNAFCLFSGKREYKIVAQEQVETLVFLNFIPAFSGLLNVLIQAFYFINLSAK